MRSERALAWHITMRLAGDRVIAGTPAALRRVASALIARARGRDLLAFCVAGTHVHVVLGCSREQAGVFARTAEQSLQLGLGLEAPFERARLLEVVGAEDAAVFLGLTQPAARRLGARPSDPLLVRAVRGQLALQTWAGRRRAHGLPSAESELDDTFVVDAGSEVGVSRLDLATSDRGGEEGGDRRPGVKPTAAVNSRWA